MNPVVYQMPHSPFCIPITHALRVCGVPFETRDVLNWDRSDIIAITDGAYYQVPVLVHGEKIVFESSGSSQDVARYVDSEFAGGRLFPARLDGLQAIVVDFLEDDVEGVTFRLVDPHYLDAVTDKIGKVMTIRHKERKFGRGCVDEWRRNAGALRQEADRLLNRFEVTLEFSRFLFGDEPVYSDFLLYGILGNMTWKGWNTLSEEQSSLRRWRSEMEGLEFRK
jgi:glutathione S-transferase